MTTFAYIAVPKTQSNYRTKNFMIKCLKKLEKVVLAAAGKVNPIILEANSKQVAFLTGSLPQGSNAVKNSCV